MNRGFFSLMVLCFFPQIVMSQDVLSVTIDGSDAIFLAGRTDVDIPPANEPWEGPGTFLARHDSPTPEEILETLPPVIFGIEAGDIISASDPATGGISFFNGIGDPLFGPSGNGTSGSSLTSLDGISGYIGPQGPLTGVFLNDDVPATGPAPSTLDFSNNGLGTDFPELNPDLNQVFYIGDGIDSLGEFQRFIAPNGSTRLALGVPDGFGFGGVPGAYDDNDGSYRVLIGINATPVPEPSTLLILAVVGALMVVHRERLERNAR